ncbi:MAG: YciK family oxidoreductase [Chromatiales bacterium]|jgi:NAD(P)-dependent dehydrogenase (short-subunit alcohol dehydrogenase family)
MQNYNAPADLLNDRIVLVTGAGKGIGRMASLAYAQHGATVILLDKDLGLLESVYDEIEAQGYPEAAIYPMDLQHAGPDAYDTLAETLEKEFGRLDGLLHNAAQLKLLSRIDDYDFETWYQVLQVNLNAPFMITQVCLPLLRESEQASLLFTSDTVGRHGKAYWGAYGVSKFGIEGLMQILAQELENSAIRVNSIDPGPTATDLRHLAYPGEDKSGLKSAEDLAPLYLWLMGRDSHDTHGQAISYEA